MSQPPNINFTRTMDASQVETWYPKCNEGGNVCCTNPSERVCGGREWYYYYSSCSGNKAQVRCGIANPIVCGYGTPGLSAEFPLDNYNRKNTGIPSFKPGGTLSALQPNVNCNYSSNFISTLANDPVKTADFVNKTNIATKNPTQYNALMQWYCSTTSNKIGEDPNCITYCSDPTNKGWCDPRMQTYCKTPTNLNKNICNCVNTIVPRPSCFDARCTSSGYRTGQQVEDAKNCGSAVVCIAALDCYNNVNCNIDRVKFELNCSQYTGSTPAPSPPPNGGGDWINFFESLKAFLIGFVIFLAIIFVLWLVFAIARSWTSSASGGASGGT